MQDNNEMNEDLEPDTDDEMQFGEEVEDTEDGGAIIKMVNEIDVMANEDHFRNIIEDIDPLVLNRTVANLLTLIEEDKRAREARDKLYAEGLKRTGLGDEAPGGANFEGANKTVHPLLSEACVDFAARAMKEIFPSGGPVKAKIMGLKDKAKIDKAQRKTEFMNWQITEQITEFRSDLEKLLTQVPLGGGQYLKIVYNQVKRRPTVEFVPIDDILLPYAASNFYCADRRTHVQRITQSELEARIRDGMYIDLALPQSPIPEETKADAANDKIEGKDDDTYNIDGRRIVYEIQFTAVLEEEGDDDARPMPYVISIDETSEEALSVYRNWAPDSEDHEELQWMVEFPFVPWRGAYPIGLTHLIGGLTGSATGALRALLDSAHIQNLPTLLKLKSAGQGQNINLTVAQITELEAGLTDDIRKLVMAVPFNPPSATLFQLLGFLVDSGKGVVRTSFEDLANIRQDAPVGTTLALIEQGLVVFSSIHARLHAAMGLVLKILHRINKSYLPAEGVATYGGEQVKPEDFDGPLDVIPVSDPNIFSDTQRFAQTQAVMQRQQVVPDLYDKRLVEEMFLRQLKVSDEILVKKEEPENLDPASENVAMSMGSNAFVLPYQDHIGHLRCHMQFMQSQTLGANPVIMQSVIMKVVPHIRDHMLQYYLQQCHEAVRMAIEGGLISEDDAGAQTMIIVQVQQEVDQLLAPVSQLLGQLAQQAQAMMPQPPQDHTLQVAQMNLQARGQEVQAKGQMHEMTLMARGQEKQMELAARGQEAQMELQKDMQIEAAKDERERMRLAQQAKVDEAKLTLEERAQQLEERALQLTRENADFQREFEAFKQERELDQRARSDDMRYQMNTDDNQTAMDLAQLEIETGEKFSVSTGTGINPGQGSNR